MSFKLLLLQLGFTCSTAADKLRFILSDSQCLGAFNRCFPFFLVIFTSESGNLLTYMKMPISRLLLSNRWTHH